MMLTKERLRELLHYDEMTGKFVRRVPVYRWKAGSVAGSVMNAGYLHITIDGKKHLAHRLAFLYMTGTFPSFVDHINGRRTDNRWHNLREVTKSQNSRNSKKSSANTSGVTGVHWSKAHSKWRADIHAGGSNLYLGLFDSLLDAASARKSAELEHGFHTNHGRR